MREKLNVNWTHVLDIRRSADERFPPGVQSQSEKSRFS
jgi:hypothetical protein